MIALASAGSLLAAALPQPSFDCAQASNPGERLVCADPALAAADRGMAKAYAAALPRSGDVRALRLAQRAALKVRDACTTRGCVAAWYNARTQALAPPPPPRLMVGRCTLTHVVKVGPRLEGEPNSGAFIAYADGLTQVSYDTLSAVRRSRAGDPVRLCLVSRPRGCPPGDTRGSIYAARNSRTGARWTAGDASHQCGGA